MSGDPVTRLRRWRSGFRPGAALHSPHDDLRCARGLMAACALSALGWVFLCIWIAL